MTTEQRIEQLAARIRDVLPTDTAQRSLLNFLIGFLVDDPDFNEAVDVYLGMAVRRERVSS